MAEAKIETGYDLSDLRVLVCDDSMQMWKLLEAFLRGYGVEEIERAADADEGFEAVCNADHDLVITDWNMEPTSGLDLVKKIRSHPRSPNPFVPIIMLTGYTEQHKVEAARDSGISAFLAKPISASSLYRRIVAVVDDQRIFVRSGTGYFGPDRRASREHTYSGRERRKTKAVGAV